MFSNAEKARCLEESVAVERDRARIRKNAAELGYVHFDDLPDKPQLTTVNQIIEANNLFLHCAQGLPIGPRRDLAVTYCYAIVAAAKAVSQPSPPTEPAKSPEEVIRRRAAR